MYAIRSYYDIEERKSFVLEAGAGSGKTYALIQTLNYLIQHKSENLKIANQKIVCITYTNVAKNEIIDRIENNELVEKSKKKMKAQFVINRTLSGRHDPAMSRC